MKTRALLRTWGTAVIALVTATTLTGPALADTGAAGPVHVHDHTELVAQPTVLRLYVRLLGQPTDVSKSSAKLTLLSGSTKQEVALKPAGDHLEATGTFPVAPGTKAVAVVTIDGTPATARFTLK